MVLTLLFEEPIFYVLLVGITIGSIVLHELGHALAATWQGDPTPRIRGHLTWNPVVHMGWWSLLLAATIGLAWGLTPTDPAYFRNRRWGEAIVGFAGPAVHLFLAGAASFALHALPGFRTTEPESAERWMILFWELVLWRNCALFLLNMIPVPPLDGFHVAEGFVNFGEFGQWMRRSHPMPMIIMFVLINQSVVPFMAAVKMATHALGGTLIP